MMEEVHSFALTDRWGKLHNYESVMLPWCDGHPLMLELGALAGGALAGGLDAEIGPAIRGALASMKPDLLARLLAQTHRDGIALNGGVPLEQAYRGNYAEAWAAAWEVIKHNGFFELPGGFSLAGAMSQILDELGSGEGSGPQA